VEKNGIMASSDIDKTAVRSALQKPIDEQISELMNKRKLQQEALLKIKASITSCQPTETERKGPGSEPKLNS
jgi:hypothetical protein